MEKKVTKTYRYDEEVIEHSEKNPLISSFANWACEKYRNEFLGLETKNTQLKEALGVVDKLKAEIENIKNKEQEAYNILEDFELAWIKNEAPARIARASFEGVYNFFIRRYKKDITRRQFRLLVEQQEKEK